MLHVSLRLALVSAMAVAGSSPAVGQVLFSENFQTGIDPITGLPVLLCSGSGGPGTYPFAAGWLLRNVDNRTPDGQVAYVNDAWEVREDFNFGTSQDCAAFSTSWYSPPGAADDWMWTPLIGPLPAGYTRLSWRAVAYDPNFRDGYEVRVMVAPSVPTGGTGVIGNQITDSTVVFSTAAEETAWTLRSVDLSAYAGQQISIGFRNNSNDRFLLLVDDVVVETVRPFDPSLHDVRDTASSAYAEVPAPLAYPLQLAADVRNDGVQALTDVMVGADVLVNGAPVLQLASDAVATLAPGERQTVAVGSAVYDTVGTWTAEALVTAEEGDQDPTNSSRVVTLVEVTADALSRAEGDVTGIVGIGSGDGGEIGTDFTLPVRTVLQGVRVAMNNPDELPPAVPPDDGGDGVGDFNGYAIELRLRAWDEVAGAPGEVLATTTATVADDAAIGALTLEFDLDGQVVPAGRYVFTVVEPVTPEPRTLALHTMPNRYTPDTTWAFWNALGSWANLEDFGAAFQRALDITVVLRLPILLPVAEDDAYVVPAEGPFAGDVSANDTPSDDGENVWSVVTPPAAGDLVLQQDGAFEYTPVPTHDGGTVTFEYQLCDADAECDTATVALDVLGVPVLQPTAVDDAFVVPPRGVFAGDVSANDTLSDDGGHVWSVATPPASGDLTMAPDGSFEYTPVTSDDGGAVGFDYTLCDIDDDCDTASVTLDVLGLRIFGHGFEADAGRGNQRAPTATTAREPPPTTLDAAARALRGSSSSDID